VFVVKPIRYRNYAVVEAIIPRLIPTNQQDCHPTGVERVEHAVWAALMLNTKLSHSAMSRLLNAGAVRKRNLRSRSLYQLK